MGVDQRFDRLLKDRVQSLAGLGAQAQEYLVRATSNIAKAAARKAADLTPRSENADAFLQGAGVGPAGGHVADAWQVEEKPAGAYGVRLRVYNSHPKASQKMRLANGSVAPYTLLDILEYGSKPHRIAPVNAPYLVFFWGKVGRTVHAQVVRHPGTRPYGMLRIATLRANVDAKRALDAVRTAVRLSLSGGRALSALSRVDRG